MTIKMILLAMTVLTLFTSCEKDSNNQTTALPTEILYTMPDESGQHEGTWLQWPHEYQYGVTYRNRIDQTWVDMTKELVTSEKVHLIVYDATEQSRVTTLLTNAKVSLTNIDF